ncbi:uncharacterized protein N7515_008830 [Penicillium bovifimosum]|uniref:Peptidase C14 caspase domain-containing protein n=1 Tax=Penicillium bovifimosum TaxID=126998 RepID=A0A9W9KXR8_9EURO|nr:uncharacterized protein N7515_008830 [Penicillium bovifimosum]KAJ5125005.1 hypothetical protein N7515_008830 [Penicillium bovifimosum]
MPIFRTWYLLRAEATCCSAASRSGSFLLELGLVGNETGMVLGLGLAAAGCFAGDLIPNSDQTPAWSLQEKLDKLLGQCIRSSLSSLFIFYYAGHGGLHDGALCFTSRHKRIRWRSIIGTLESAQPVDSLVILDCCHAAAAARQPNSTTNIQIIAACGAHEIASERSNRASFTQRLFRAVQRFKGQENFTTAEWYQQVQLEKPKNAPHAVFETLSGTGTISLGFNNASTSRIPRPVSGVSQKHVLVKLTLEGQRDAVDSFSKAVRSLPANMQVEICSAFETDASIFFIMQMSWEGWLLWTSVIHLDFVGVTLGSDLLHPFLSQTDVWKPTRCYDTVQS